MPNQSVGSLSKAWKLTEWAWRRIFTKGIPEKLQLRLFGPLSNVSAAEIVDDLAGELGGGGYAPLVVSMDVTATRDGAEVRFAETPKWYCDTGWDIRYAVLCESGRVFAVCEFSARVPSGRVFSLNADSAIMDCRQ